MREFPSSLFRIIGKKPSLRQIARVLAVTGAWLGGLAMITLVGLQLGCQSPEQKYKVLSFFFDGVPPPPGMEVDLPPRSPWEPPLTPQQAAGEGAADTADATAKAEVFYHEPYMDRQCYSCHPPDKSFTAPEGGRVLCGKCHESHWDRQPTDWVHGPVAVDQCQVCHDPHKSQYRPLLTAAAEQICFDCHDQTRVLDRPYHAEIGEAGCGTCHDPHFSGNRMLLVDATTYQRRAEAGRAAPASAHTNWTVDDCTLCHDITQSNALLDNIDSVCIDCHGPVMERAAATQGTHEAITDRQCLSCHTPHRSPKDYLLRTAGEEVCFTCHQPEEIQTPDHPRVNSVDCFVCHRGHEADRPMLLKTGHADWVREDGGRHPGDPLPDEKPLWETPGDHQPDDTTTGGAL